MKILQINAVSGIRSTGRTCAEIADYLNKNGDEGYVAYSDGLPYNKGYKIGTLLEIKLHGLFSRISGLPGYFSKKGTRKFLRYLGELAPDIVHLRNLHGNFINLELLLTYLADHDIPTVLTLHDCWFYTGKCCHYTVETCFKWKRECSNCPRVRKDNPSWFLDRTRKMYQDKKKWFQKIPRLAVVGTSDWVTHEAKQSLLASAKIVTRIYNWVDLEVFKPVNADDLRCKLGLKNQFVILGIASGWSEHKGLNKFIELSSLIENDMSLILVGNISSGKCLPKNIIHIKETQDVNELVRYYSVADVLVNLSIEETFGKVTAEALACGTPAIVINSTANPELVGEGCGYIVGKYDIRAVVQSILDIRKQGKSVYSQNCRRYAQSHFDKNNRMLDYVALYERLMGKRDLRCI